MFSRLRSPWLSRCAVLALLLPHVAMSATQSHHPPLSRRVAVDNNVQLHYLDFGGSGPALVFLPGLGSTAWIFSDFGGHFVDKFHVYALTRRGYGSSDLPSSGYDLATRVEDIQGFLQGMGIRRVILAGHSIAGDEMSAFAAKYPDSVEALIYLDAAYDRADSRTPRPDPAVMATVQQSWYGGEQSLYSSLDSRREAMKKVYFGIWSDAQEKNMREITVVNVDGTAVDRTPRWVDDAVREDSRKQRSRLVDVKAPALLLFARQRLENRPIRLDRATRRALEAEEDRYQKYFNAYLGEIRRKNFKITVLQNTMHALFLEKPTEVAKLMRMFLAEHEKGR